MATAALMGLGGALAPTYAEDTAAAVALPAATALQTSIATPDPALPRFAPQADDNSLTATPAPDSAQADTRVWEPVGSGVASWYGAELAGHRTASGERFNPNELTAAHRTLPLGTQVKVTYAGRSVIVRVNDRGPFAGHRVIDLSRAAAEQIGLRRAGSGRVTLAVLDAGGDSSQ